MAAKREKVIITCAVTGSVHTPLGQLGLDG
jgi:uncharacterized protein (DUF849 family)